MKSVPPIELAGCLTAVASRAGRCLASLAVVGLYAACGSPTAPTPEPPPPPAPLTLICPADVETESRDDRPVAVNVGPPVPQGGTSPITVVCSPTLETAFPVGSTRVTCTASDTRNQTASCGFSVIVKPARRLAAARFLAFGDSITEGFVSPSPLHLLVIPSAAYPVKLQAMLSERYRVQTFTVINAGRGGELASEGGVRRFRDVLLAHRPEVVLLMEGTNDLFFHRTNASERAIPALEAMIREARSSRVTLFLATVPPQRRGGPRDFVASLLPGFNRDVRALAQRTAVTLVDVYAAMEGNVQTLIGVDDVHPTEAGYTVIARTFADVITATLEVSSSTSGHETRGRRHVPGE